MYLSEASTAHVAHRSPLVRLLDLRISIHEMGRLPWRLKSVETKSNGSTAQLNSLPRSANLYLTFGVSSSLQDKHMK
jgi:hypothetical protein